MLVQRWPAVPTAPNTIAGIASFRSAEDSTIIALLPPSSSSERPMRRATRSPTWRPTFVEPVKLIIATRLSSTMRSASALSVSLNRKNRSGKPPALSASLQMRIEAIADSGVLPEGFQIEMSPQTAATNEFHAHTATGKLNAEMIPTMPSGCHCSYMRWPGRSECMVRP